MVHKHYYLPEHAHTFDYLNKSQFPGKIMVAIQLRDVETSDLDHFFAHQQNKDAQYMAAFISKDPSDREVFDAHWQKIISRPDLIMQTIVSNNEVLGHIGKFVMFDEPQITYWIGSEYWGKGIATEAVHIFLKEIKVRPLYARTAKDNRASARVLEKNGFVKVREEKGFANARGKEIEELVFELK